MLNADKNRLHPLLGWINGTWQVHKYFAHVDTNMIDIDFTIDVIAMQLETIKDREDVLLKMMRTGIGYNKNESARQRAIKIALHTLINRSNMLSWCKLNIPLPFDVIALEYKRPFDTTEHSASKSVKPHRICIMQSNKRRNEMNDKTIRHFNVSLFCSFFMCNGAINMFKRYHKLTN